MSKAYSKHKSSKSKSNEIIIPKEVIEALEKMPIKKDINYRLIDAVIFKYYQIYSAKTIGRVLNVDPSTISNRIRVLGLR